MSTAVHQAFIPVPRRSLIARWFVPGMATLMLAISIAGFTPAIVNPAGRRAPLSALAAAHGFVFYTWLLLFLLQSVFVATGRVARHRRLGLASVFVLALMVPLGYVATVTMVRRGFDLSGDQGIVQDPLGGSIFNFGYLFAFTILAVGAICFRRRPAIHKRLMLFANIELTGAPLAHLLGHFKLLTPATVALLFLFLLLAAVARDYLADKRIHPLTAGLAFVLFILQPIDGILMSTPAWHHVAAWLTR
jgi:hypothetical protein